MSEGLSAAEQREFTGIIDDILKKADLNTISAKAIRKGLQAQVDHDISAQKKAITDLIMARFDKMNSAQAAAAVPTTETAPAPATNGKASSPAPVKREANGTTKKRPSPSPEDDDEDALSDVVDSPPPKRKKIEKSQAETDAEYAKRLQAELNRISGRATRGGGAGAKRKPVVKKQKKRKSKAHVGSDDDSDAGSGEKKEVKRTGGFHKPMALSPQLSALVNETQLSRPQTVKKIWEYIKARDLQDPNDKRQIICDDAMRNVFKTDKVHMFTMNKIINTHLYEVDEV